MSDLTHEIALNVNVFVEFGGEDDPVEVPAIVELEAGTLWVYVSTEGIRKQIAELLNAPTGVSDVGLGLHGLAVSQHYRMAWVSARDRARRLRGIVERIKALVDDPWHGDANWNAVHHTGVSRRGGLRGGDFVAVDDLAAALRGDA